MIFITIHYNVISITLIIKLFVTISLRLCYDAISSILEYNAFPLCCHAHFINVCYAIISAVL